MVLVLRHLRLALHCRALESDHDAPSGFKVRPLVLLRWRQMLSASDQDWWRAAWLRVHEATLKSSSAVLPLRVRVRNCTGIACARLLCHNNRTLIDPACDQDAMCGAYCPCVRMWLYALSMRGRLSSQSVAGQVEPFSYCVVDLRTKVDSCMQTMRSMPTGASRWNRGECSICAVLLRGVSCETLNMACRSRSNRACLFKGQSRLPC